MLDAELHNIKKIIDSGKKLEDLMIDTNVKINVGKDSAQYPIRYLQMKWKSQLLPHLCSLKGEEKRNAERILAPIFNVLLTDKVQLEILRNPPPVRSFINYIMVNRNSLSTISMYFLLFVIKFFRANSLLGKNSVV
ncbi:MAG: hypothetical protein IPF75_05270 [Bacteroidetes bacterium]|nr:hypothetical protein [Bacteroidota bacterium]